MTRTSLVVVAFGCLCLLSCADAAFAGRQARVRLAEETDYNVPGDTASGVLWGTTGYNLTYSCTGDEPIAGVSVSLLAPTGVLLGEIDSRQGWYFTPWYFATPYNLESVTWHVVGPSLPLGDHYLWADATPGSVQVDPGITVIRTVPSTTLTNNVEAQLMYVDIRLDREPDAETNLLGLWLGDAGEGELTYRLVSVNKPEPFQGSGNWCGVNPHDLTVGLTYRFVVVIEVTRTGSLAGGTLYHKLPAYVSIGHSEQMPVVTGLCATQATAAGARVCFRAGESTQFDGNIDSPIINIDFDAVAARIGPAQPASIFLSRGRRDIHALPLHSFGAQVEGANLSGATVTCNGKTFALSPDDIGQWEFDRQSLDAALLTDFTAGLYTLTCYSTDGSPPVVVQVDATGMVAPGTYPLILSPTGDTTDTTPTLRWTPPTGDPNVNTVVVAMEAGDYEVEKWLPPDAGQWTPVEPLPLGGCLSAVIFANIREGQSQGVQYTCAWYTTRDRLLNIVPFNVAATLNYDWVYQNTPVTTLDRHMCQLSLGASGAPDNYSVSVTERCGGGNLTLQQSPNPMLWLTYGGRAGSSTPGPLILDVFARSSTSGLGAPAAAPLILRRLGDIDGDGAVTAADKLEMNKALNGLANLPGIGLRHLDLTGDGVTVNAEDKLVMNQVLNGVVVP